VTTYLQTNPSGLFRYGFLKECHADLACRMPDIVGKESRDKWSGDMADKVMTVLNHCRRLHDTTRWQQAIKDLSKHQIDQLSRIRALVQTEESEVSARSLRPRLSDCSVDSQGLPNLASLGFSLAAKRPANEVCEDGLLSEALAAPLLPCRKQELKTAVQAIKAAAEPKGKKTEKAPKGKKTVKAPKGKNTAKAPKQTGAKEDTTGQHGDQPEATTIKKKPKKYNQTSADEKSHGTVHKKPAAALVSKSFGKLILTLASAQSYIQYIRDDKKTLLVSVSQGQSACHGKVVQELAQFALQAGLTKEQVVQRRDSLLASPLDIE